MLDTQALDKSAIISIGKFHCLVWIKFLSSSSIRAGWEPIAHRDETLTLVWLSCGSFLRFSASFPVSCVVCVFLAHFPLQSLAAVLAFHLLKFLMSLIRNLSNQFWSYDQFYLSLTVWAWCLLSASLAPTLVLFLFCPGKQTRTDNLAHWMHDECGFLKIGRDLQYLYQSLIMNSLWDLVWYPKVNSFKGYVSGKYHNSGMQRVNHSGAWLRNCECRVVGRLGVLTD